MWAFWAPTQRRYPNSSFRSKVAMRMVLNMNSPATSSTMITMASSIDLVLETMSMISSVMSEAGTT